MMKMLPHPFDRLDHTELRTINLPTGAHLFSQSDPTSGMFYVNDGLLQLQRHTENGDKVTIHQARLGETFAEASLFSVKYHCDAVAQAPTIITVLPKGAVLNLFETDGEFAAAVAGRFAKQVQSYRRRIELLAIRSAEQRTYSAIADGMLHTSILDLAAQIGLTHEATYRALRKLVLDGRLIKTGRGKYRMKDMSR